MVKELPRTITAFSGICICVGANIGAGVFIVPGLLVQLLGSVGMALTLFIVGGISCFLATWTYVELGLMNPVSGGDKEYLDLAFPYPKALFSFLLCQVRVWMINPGQVAAVSVAAGKFFLEGLYGTRGVLDKSSFLFQNFDYIARAISCVMVVMIMAMHTFMPKKAILVQDSMVVVKASLLFGGIIIGIVTLCGGTAVKPSGNLNNLFEGTILDINPLASAFLKVLFVYDGWSTLNYALSEVIEPEKNFPISAFSAITISSLLFNFFSLMMFAVVPKANIINPDMGFISSQFFTLTLGPLVGSKILPFMIALSAFSCAMCNVFTGSRLLFEAAREGFLPYSSRFSAISNFDSPANALLHIGCLSIFYIVVPPPGKAYEFLIDLVTYPQALFYALVVIGCLLMRFTRPNVPRPVKSTWVGNIIYICIAIGLALAPFIPPSTPDSIPYWLSPALGLVSIFLFGIYYYRKVVVGKCMETSYKTSNKEMFGDDNWEKSFEDKI